MFRLLKHILIFLAVVLIVAATGGISLIRHYCSCSGENLSSIYSKSFDCHQDDGDHCCVKSPAGQNENCCSSNSRDGAGKHVCEPEHNCCSTVYSYFKTDQVNLIESLDKSWRFYPVGQTAFSVSETKSLTGKELVQPTSDRSPPPIYGMQLLILLHQLKSGPLFS
jgi:hypothetical protein